MNTIKLDRYLSELSSLYSFYRYCESVFADSKTHLELGNMEFQSMYETALPFLEDSPMPSDELPARLEEIVRRKVADDISSGLATLRRQILETAHSIFEKFLCHIVRVYFHTFPEIMKDIEKSISFREIVEIKENDAIFNHIVEKEISHFSRRSLHEKKDYLVKHLKLTRQDDLWSLKGEDLWKDIDHKRQAIVHREEIPEISHEYLLHVIVYLQQIMMGIAIYAQRDQGVPLQWMGVEDLINRKPRPTLKGK